MNEVQVIYREAKHEDWEPLASFRRIYSKEDFEIAKARFDQDFKDIPHKNLGKLYVAEHSDEVVGYGRVGLFDPESGQELYGLTKELPRGLYLKGIVVHERVRSKGVGIKLTELRIDYSRRANIPLYCFLQKDNIPSVKLHEKLGFNPIATGLAYPGDSEADGTGVLFEYGNRTK